MCAHQTAIPTKDANIAREALEILVTCLQLRSELIGQFCCIVVVVVFLMPTSPVRPWRFDVGIFGRDGGLMGTHTRMQTLAVAVAVGAG